MEYRINLTDDTVEQLGRVLGEPVQELEQEILEKEETIAEKDEIIAEKQAIIDAFPTIESKSITANGTYSEEGKAYSPVVVNVPQTTVEALSVTQNGTYSEEGKAYSPVTVNVPEGLQLSINTMFRVQNFTNDKYLLVVGNINQLTSYDLNTATIVVANPNSQGSFTSAHKMVKRVSDGKVFISAALINMSTGDIRALSSSDISSVTHGSVGTEDHQLYVVPEEGCAEVSMWVKLNAA